MSAVSTSSLIATETSSLRTNMRVWWDSWSGYNSAGWYWGSEKQAADGTLSQLEDYKGLVDEMRFWSVAKSPTEIATNYNAAVNGTEPGHVGYYTFGEGSGLQACETLVPADCIDLINTDPSIWSSQDAPVGDPEPTPTPTPLPNAVDPQVWRRLP